MLFHLLVHKQWKSKTLIGDRENLMKQSIPILVILLCMLVFSGCRLEKPEVLVQGPGTAQQNSQGLSLFGVTLSAPSFNPSRGDKVECRYNLSRDAPVTVKRFDA